MAILLIALMFMVSCSTLLDPDGNESNNDNETENEFDNGYDDDEYEDKELVGTDLDITWTTDETDNQFGDNLVYVSTTGTGSSQNEPIVITIQGASSSCTEESILTDLDAIGTGDIEGENKSTFISLLGLMVADGASTFVYIDPASSSSNIKTGYIKVVSTDNEEKTYYFAITAQTGELYDDSFKSAFLGKTAFNTTINSGFYVRDYEDAFFTVRAIGANRENYYRFKYATSESTAVYQVNDLNKYILVSVDSQSITVGSAEYSIVDPQYYDLFLMYVDGRNAYNSSKDTVFKVKYEYFQIRKIDDNSGNYSNYYYWYAIDETTAVYQEDVYNNDSCVSHSHVLVSQTPEYIEANGTKYDSIYYDDAFMNNFLSYGDFKDSNNNYISLDYFNGYQEGCIVLKDKNGNTSEHYFLLCATSDTRGIYYTVADTSLVDKYISVEILNSTTVSINGTKFTR